MHRLVLLLLAVATACGGPSRDGGTASRPRVPGPRFSMHALHQMGGVPPGWQLSPPSGDVAAGRLAFGDFGCATCHRVEGEAFSVKASTGQVGPELTGMGGHHPPAYFAEAILNPDAVLIEGPGYIGPDGHSVMPDYPDMTVQQLGDLVAYLSSLKSGGPHAGHMMSPPTDMPPNPDARPAPPELPAKAFFIQSYDVKADQLGPFETWWKEKGAKRFLAFDGLVSVDTYVDFACAQRPFTSMFGFRDNVSLHAFMQDPLAEALGLEFDGFIGSHTHVTQPWPPIYRVEGLSAAAK